MGEVFLSGVPGEQEVPQGVLWSGWVLSEFIICLSKLADLGDLQTLWTGL